MRGVVALILLCFVRGAVAVGCAITPDGSGHVNVPPGTIAIQDGAFSGCTALESITFPTSLETIGNDAFSGCTSLVEAKLAHTQVMSIGSRAFNECTELTTLTVPSTLQTTGSQLLRNCDKLQALDLSSTSMVSLGYQWFAFALNERRDVRR